MDIERIRVLIISDAAKNDPTLISAQGQIVINDADSRRLTDALKSAVTFEVDTIRNMFESLLFTREEVDAGFFYLYVDDGESFRFKDEFGNPTVMGRIERLEDVIIPGWEIQEVLSSNDEAWNDWVVEMLRVQREWLTNEQLVDTVLTWQLAVHLVKERYGIDTAFEVPQSIINNSITIEEKKVELLKAEFILLVDSGGIRVTDFGKLPLIPLEWDEEKERRPQPSNVFLIDEVISYWLTDDRDLSQPTVMGRLDRIDAGITYFNRIIDNPDVSEAAKAIFRRFIANLQREKTYYDEHAKEEINKDRAFQVAIANGQAPNETSEAILGRKGRGLTELLSIKVDRLALIGELGELGPGIFVDDLGEKIQDIVQRHRRVGEDNTLR